jgi:NTE family protein
MSGAIPTRKLRPIEQHPPFERIALLLQGGGALGSYQAGVYQALAETGLHPDWIAGISIGAVNAALIAGNPPEKRIERLWEFWEAVSTPPLGVPYLKSLDLNDSTRRFVNQARALGILLFGAPHFFVPRSPLAVFFPNGGVEAASFYDTSPLQATLERLVDFDRINADLMHLSVGAVNVRTGNFAYFDSATTRIGPSHIIASGSLPPGFPPTEIDGEYYWDGGLVSNTPLQYVLDARPRQDTLAFQVDLWNAEGELPCDVSEAQVRLKEIQYSSRTRAATQQYKRAQKLRLAVAKLIGQLPEEARNSPETRLLEQEADDKVCNIVHLIYRAKSYQGIAKDFEFSRRTMEEHWQSGYDDAARALEHPEVLQPPGKLEGVRTFDFAKSGSSKDATEKRHEPG